MSSAFQQAEQYLLGTINETISRRMPYRLERMHAFLEALGDPQDAYPTVHIGGTSGKGSTSTMVAAVLQASGKRTGLHTKPHLKTMRERARVDGIAIGEEQFAELLDEMMPAIERTTSEYGRPTYYETLLALAFLHFARELVDVAVIEVGLGGRLDGTNVIVPQVAAITSVGYDHIDVLGDTLEAIATEKAGIAKAGVPLVVGVTDPEIRGVIAGIAGEVGAPVVYVTDVASVADAKPAPFGQSFSIATPSQRYEIETPVLGAFQRQNAAAAVAIVEQLQPPLRPNADAVRAAFETLSIPGRMEVFPGYPPVVFDIAHNVEKAEKLAASLRESFGDRHFTFVVAVTEGKDAVEIVRALGALPSSFIFTGFHTEGRSSIPPVRLARMAEDAGLWGRAMADPVEALAVARRNAANVDVIVVTGSTFVVSQLREWWIQESAAGRARA